LTPVEALDVEPDDLEALLALARVSAEHLREVGDVLRGDVPHAAFLIVLLLNVLYQDVDCSAFEAADSEAQLTILLEAHPVPGWSAEDAVRLALESADLRSFARAVSGTNPELELDRWNAALRRLGRPVLEDQAWSTGFRAHLDEASGLLKRVTAQLAREGVLPSYLTTLDAIRAIPDTLDLSQTVWRVSMSRVTHHIALLLRECGCPEELVAAIDGAVSVDALRAQLAASAVALDIDPDECFRANHRAIEATAAELDNLHLAWTLKGERLLSPTDWKSAVPTYVAQAGLALEQRGYLSTWSQEEVFKTLAASLTVGQDHSLWERSLKDANSLAELRAALGVSDDDLAATEQRLTAVKESIRRSRNRIQICGENFEASEDNLGKLWDLLEAAIDDATLASGEGIDVRKPAELQAVKTRSPGAKPKAPREGKGVNHSTRSRLVDDAIGMAGEIAAFRMLRVKYGSDIVTPSCWKSTNGWRIFPQNAPNDAQGCDFVFVLDGCEYSVEVKASAGDDDFFVLGSSEICLAMEIARQRRRRKAFLIVHVKSALSGQPTAAVLPNPYDSRYSRLYSIEEADARVRYRPQ
jgi:hypothetical protein